MKTTMKGLMMALIIFCSASVALAYTVNWPTVVRGEQGATHVGIIIGDYAASGQHVVVDIDQVTGDMYIYSIYGSDASPGTVQYTDGKVWPAFLYGKIVGSDSVTGYNIYDVYVSGSGIGGTFAYWNTFSL